MMRYDFALSGDNENSGAGDLLFAGNRPASNPIKGGKMNRWPSDEVVLAIVGAVKEVILAVIAKK